MVCLKVNWEAHAKDTLKPGGPAVWCTEGRFYRYLRPHLPAPAPLGYYGDFDDATGQGICIMEDLVQRGAVFGDNTRPLTPDQAALVLDDLADLHAAWWGSPRLDEFQWLLKSFMSNNYKNNPARLEAMIAPPERAALLKPDQQDIGLWVKAIDKIVEDEPSSTQPFCLIHGDTHLGNSYYLPGSEKLLWLDWQLVSKGRPPREVNYFLTCALDVETRRANERDLIRHYLEALRSKGVEPPGFDDFWRSYRLWPIWGLVAWGFTGDGWQPVPTIHETMRRFGVAIDDMETFKGL